MGGNVGAPAVIPPAVMGGGGPVTEAGMIFVKSTGAAISPAAYANGVPRCPATSQGKM